MAERKLYKVAPGAPEWLTEDEMIDRIKRWAANAPEYGAPSVTISTLVVPDTRGPRCGKTVIVSTRNGDFQYACDRDPGHTWPHRDVQQKGNETLSW